MGRILLDAVAQGVLNFVLFLFQFAWWVVRWSFATACFLVVMAGAGYYVFNEVLAGGEYVAVPDITRRHVTDASYRLAEAGLELGKLKEMPDERVPKGYVILQRPKAGKVVRTGRKVYPTVSSGTKMVQAPNYLRRTLAEVRDEILQTPFLMGTVARIHHEDLPRDTVIAQDPEPPRKAESGGRIHFLVSAGPSLRTYLMPDIVGKPVQEVLQLLADIKARAIPNRVQNPGEPVDQVLAQDPAPGTLIPEGATVQYDVQPSGEVPLPDARRHVRVSYTLPQALVPQELRVDTVDQHQVRQTVYPRRRDYVNGEPPQLPPGSRVTIPISFLDELTVEFFLDGVKVESRLYRGSAEPIVTYADTAGAML